MTATCACGQTAITVDAPPVVLGVCHGLDFKHGTGCVAGRGLTAPAHAVPDARREPWVTLAAGWQLHAD